MESCRFLDWDSGFFGYRVCSIRPNGLRKGDLDNLVEELRGNGTRLLYCFVDPGDTISSETIEASSGKLVDSKVTYFKTVPETLDFEQPGSISAYESKDPSPELVRLALESGVSSRFRLDPNFRNNEFERMYTEWIVKSVRKEISDLVLVYHDDDGAEKGFVTLKISGGTGTIGLIAVDENTRGKSVGKKLMNSVLLYLHDRNIKIAEVATQKDNHQACRFYEAIGFGVKDVINVYHLWIS